ncbi:protein kinase [Nonomuraea pusilla]|uniref:serine/threonine-protein kinase n=1 Tax=Nonomuraea pusilla TaxID=46177 RepID=UPI003332972A
MRLGNRYLLISRIAAGGMGEVWRARDELLGREVAVKLLRSHIHADPSFRGRFRNEARITAALSDPGVAQVFDYGEERDLAYLVMELVPGEPLSAILARNGALGPDVTLDVTHQTARALHAAHAAGIIHRDVKPGNLLVTSDGVIKVTDFGIARAMEAAPMTQDGIVLGTAQYASPEQAQGLPLTPATDLYSLGVVAYECLAGRTPFQGDNQVAIALRHLHDPPPPLGVDVPAPVRDLVMGLLAKQPESRPGSAMEVADRAYVLRDALAEAAGQGAGRGADLSALTDPDGFHVRAPGSDGFHPGADGFHGGTPGPDGLGARTPGPRVLGVARPGPDGFRVPTSQDGGDGTRPLEPATVVHGPVPQRPAGRGQYVRRRGGRTLALVATAGCVAAVGLSAITFAHQEGPPGTTAPPEVSEPTRTAPTVSDQPRPARTKARTRRPPVVPVKSTRPVPSRSATVITSATPTKKPTQKPTPSATTPVPTPTPTATPSSTPTTQAPTVSPSPEGTNPPKGQT